MCRRLLKNTCDNGVIVPMCELAVYTPCNVYPLLVLVKTKSKPKGLSFH